MQHQTIDDLKETWGTKQETIMLRIALTISASIILLAGPALSMTTREGFVACDKNPKCKSTVYDDGGVVFVGPDWIVFCRPNEKECELIGGRNGTKIGKTLRPAKIKDMAVKAQ
jgi:hypothetical protein